MTSWTPGTPVRLATRRFVLRSLTRQDVGERYAGWLRDPDDPESRISQATAEEVRAGLDAVEGGMRPKLTACVYAIAGGVEAAHIVDGRRPHTLLLELFTDAGIGTKITA